MFVWNASIWLDRALFGESHISHNWTLNYTIPWILECSWAGGSHHYLLPEQSHPFQKPTLCLPSIPDLLDEWNYIVRSFLSSVTKLKVYSQVASVCNVVLLNSVPCIQTPCVSSSSEQRNSELFLLWGFWLMLWTSVKKFEMFDLVHILEGSSGVILWQPQLYFLQWFYHHLLLSWDLGSSILHNFLPGMKRHLIGILVCISLMSNNLSFFSCVHWLSMLLCRMFISGYSLAFQLGYLFVFL